MKPHALALDFAALLRKNGYRATPGRIRLLKILSSEPKPLTVPEIQKKLRGKTDAVTLYRSLDAFADSDLVHRVDLQHGHVHYEIVVGRKHHHHLTCTTCERVEDVVGCEDEQLVNKALKQTKGFSRVTNHSLELFGLCNNCINKNNLALA